MEVAQAPSRVILLPSRVTSMTAYRGVKRFFEDGIGFAGVGTGIDDNLVFDLLLCSAFWRWASVVCAEKSDRPVHPVGASL